MGIVGGAMWQSHVIVATVSSQIALGFALYSVTLILLWSILYSNACDYL